MIQSFRIHQSIKRFDVPMSITGAKRNHHGDRRIQTQHFCCRTGGFDVLADRLLANFIDRLIEGRAPGRWDPAGNSWGHRTEPAAAGNSQPR